MEHFLDFFTPENYQLDLDINKDTEELKGTVTITGTPHADTIKLHAVDMTIDSVNTDYEYRDGVLEIKVAGGVAWGTPAARSEASAVGENATTGPATVKTTRPVAENDNSFTSATTGPATVIIKYHKKLNRNMQGAYISTYEHAGTTEKIVSTQFESHYARECFPCIDEPAAKATFDISITTPDDTTTPDIKDTILANTQVKNVVKNTTHTTTHFERTPVMSTYLLAFVIGKFHHRSTTNQHGVKITSYCALNQDPDTLDFANHIAAESLDYYDEKFATPYPLQKLDQVAIPDFEAGAMENWGLVTYRESCMLAGPSSAISDQQYVATVIAHELSHQWFGNLVTMRWWDDLWLNESFANVIEYYATNAIHPEYHIWEYFFTGECVAALYRDALKGVQAVRQPVHSPEEIATLFDGAIVYAKGAHLMFMLIRLIGEDQFFAGIQDYFKQHQYGNTTGDDLWQALQPHADFDVKKFMDAWLTQPGYPVISTIKSASRSAESTPVKAPSIAQHRFLLDGSTDDSKWPLPHIKDDMSGHYLIHLSDPDFQHQLDNFNHLTLEQKLRLIIDRTLLAKTQSVSSASLLDLLPHFKGETSHAVWSTLLMAISDLKLFITPESPEEKQYQKYLLNLIQPQLDRLGFTKRPDDTDNDIHLRNALTGIALYTEDPDITNHLAKLYQPNLSQIDPELRPDIISAKLRLSEAGETTDTDLFDCLLTQYRTTPDPNIKADLLDALTDARNPKHLDTLISLLSKPDIIRPQDHLHFYIYLRSNHRSHHQAFAWLRDHWDYVRQLTGDKSLEDYPRYTSRGIRTREEADQYHAFFDPLSEDPALKRAIAVATDEIKARLALIAQDAPAVHNHLADF
ncbi:M1 family metallopeptidase [Candidatus Saccharibacteria bacterium]|nr:M1 family metallopeptidase [Candidatus Saccharibacteria bacterium]